MLFKTINCFFIRPFFVLFIFFSITLNADEAGQIEATSDNKIDIEPFNAEPFILPDDFKSDLKDYRKKWIRLTGFEYSQLHWQHFMVVYINQNADVYRNNNLYFMRQWSDEVDDDEIEDEGSSVSSYQSYPVNTIVLKENFTVEEGTPGSASLLTFMIKRDDNYDPDFGNWEYIQSTPDGEIVFRGNSKDPGIKQVCVDCHANINDRDFIFSNIFARGSSQ